MRCPTPAVLWLTVSAPLVPTNTSSLLTMVAVAVAVTNCPALDGALRVATTVSLISTSLSLTSVRSTSLADSPAAKLSVRLLMAV